MSVMSWPGSGLVGLTVSVAQVASSMTGGGDATSPGGGSVGVGASEALSPLVLTVLETGVGAAVVGGDSVDEDSVVGDGSADGELVVADSTLVGAVSDVVAARSGKERVRLPPRS